MEAKDTVMSAEQIMDLEEGVEDAVFCGQETPSKSYLVAKRQAEISFKRGIKEVVDRLQYCLNHYESRIHKLVPAIGFNFYTLDTKKWQAQLKKWGIA